MWHSAVATILIRTSPGPGGSTVTIQISRGFLASHATAALHTICFPSVIESNGLVCVVVQATDGVTRLTSRLDTEKSAGDEVFLLIKDRDCRLTFISADDNEYDKQSRRLGCRASVDSDHTCD